MRSLEGDFMTIQPIIRFILIFTGMVMTVSVTFAQHSVVRGTLVDSLSQDAMEEATISVFILPDFQLLRQVRSTRSGFSLGRIGHGSYVAVASFQGYEPDSIWFTIKEKDSLERNLVFNMKQASENMMEVVVHASIPPVIVRSDTIAFNAQAYPSPPNATLEDLIKKLPGIEIDKDGNVTLQGQKVDKITIDGKDFFLSDLRTATQNLPADLVAQVEAFDTQSERNKRLGVKGNSTTKTINIKLKKNKRLGYFGKVYAGGGTQNGEDQSYSVGETFSRFAENDWLQINANANNINNQFTGRENQNGAGAGLQIQNNQQLNFRKDVGKQFKIILDGSRNYDNSLVSSSLNRQTILTDSSIIQNSNSTTSNKSTNEYAAARIEWTPDSMTQLNLNSFYTHNKTNAVNNDSVAITTLKPASQYLSSLGRTMNSSSTTGNDLTNTLDLYRRFKKKGRAIYLSLGQSLSTQNLPASIFSLVQNFDSLATPIGTTLINQQSTQETSNNGYNGSVAYAEPIGLHHILDFDYSLNHSGGHSDKESYDYDSATGKYDHLDSLTTDRFINSTTVQRFSAGYNTTEGKYRFQFGLTGQLTDLNNLNRFNGQTLNQHSVNWYPRASFLWEIDKGRNLNFAYTGSSQAPTIDQLQPIPDLTNPYLIKIGNPDLRQQLTHDFVINYTAFNTKTFRNLQINLSGNYIQNDFTTASTVLAGGVQEVQAINVAGVYHISTHITYGFPLGDEKNGNASLEASANYGHDISVVNSETNTAATKSLAGTAKINYHGIKDLFADAELMVADTRSTYSLVSAPSTETLNETYRLNLSWRLPLSFTVASYYNLQVTGSQNTLPAQAVSLWNAAIYKSVLSNHSGEVRFSVFDLLNSASSFSQTTGIGYVQTMRTNLPGRLFLMSFVWRFSKFEG